jgi:2-polyprenyl-3-methyl-5-hydroxy-6-metoxy-1,4-benzoquinol methylase
MHHQEFVFKEIDVEGQATLEAISAATRFNEWMYDVISTRLTGEILEIGSGIGNISTHFFKNGHRLTVSDSAIITVSIYPNILKTNLYWAAF